MANVFKNDVKFTMNFSRCDRSIVNHGKFTVNYSRTATSIINHSNSIK